MRAAEGKEIARLGVGTQASPCCIVGWARLQDPLLKRDQAAAMGGEASARWLMHAVGDEPRCPHGLCPHDGLATHPLGAHRLGTEKRGVDVPRSRAARKQGPNPRKDTL